MSLWDDPEGEKTWDQIRRRFISQALRFGIPDTDAEDVAQEAWRKAREKLASFRFRSRLATWLNAVIRHECWQWLRPPKRQPTILPLDALDSGEESWDVQKELVAAYARKTEAASAGQGVDTPEGALLHAERVSVLKQAVERLLSEKYWLILYHSFVETHYVMPDSRVVKWTDEEIAKKAGLAPGSVATIRDRILSLLRNNPDFRQLVEHYF